MLRTIQTDPMQVCRHNRFNSNVRAILSQPTLDKKAVAVKTISIILIDNIRQIEQFIWLSALRL